MLTITIARQRVWRHATSTAMGCPVELLVDGPPASVRQGIDRLLELERCWSRFQPHSELNRLHRRAGRWTRVSDDLWSALSWCLRMHVETGGLFDPSIRDSLERWGYDRTFSEIDAVSRQAPDPHPTPGLDGLELDTTRRVVRLAPGLRIDLGGIGKGLAADMIASELVASGATGAYVCLGGDIHAAGEPRRGGWPVPLLHPSTREAFTHHMLDRGGLVMSTVAIRRWVCGGRNAHHVIDPRDGQPTASNVLAVAVAARSSARAEALAKTAIIAGVAEGLVLLRRASVTAWVLPVGDASLPIVMEAGR